MSAQMRYSTVAQHINAALDVRARLLLRAQGQRGWDERGIHPTHDIRIRKHHLTRGCRGGFTTKPQLGSTAKR